MDTNKKVESKEDKKEEGDIKPNQNIEDSKEQKQEQVEESKGQVV